MRAIEILKQDLPPSSSPFPHPAHLPSPSAPIKRECEVQLGVRSQCMVMNPRTGFTKEYFTNIALKINMKVRSARPYARSRSPFLFKSHPVVKSIPRQLVTHNQRYVLTAIWSVEYDSVRTVSLIRFDWVHCSRSWMCIRAPNQTVFMASACMNFPSVLCRYSML